MKTDHPLASSNHDYLTAAGAAADFASRILIRTSHCEVDDSLRDSATVKLGRLFRHGSRLLRIRVDVERDHARTRHHPFLASGRVEVSGPDMIARVRGDTPGEALDLLVDRLDRLLRERTKSRANRRNDPRNGNPEQRGAAWLEQSLRAKSS